MGTKCRIFLLATALFSLTSTIANGQEAPSLADLARQQRQQKTAPGKDAKAPKVITNEEIPERADPAS